MRRRLVALLLCALVVGAAACGDDGPAATSGGGDSAGTTAATGTGDDTTDSAAPTAESALAADFGLESMVILTPSSGGGDRPDLAWEPVDGAVSYKVVLLAPDGSFYWGWTGEETSVPVGGFPRLTPAAAGPRLVDGMSWTVIAHDGELRPLAAGGPTELSP